MLTVTANKYKKLLRELNKKISNEAIKFCQSEEYGYCSNKNKLLKLSLVKELLVDNFYRKKLDDDFNCTIETEELTTIKKLNKIVNGKAEIIVTKIKKVIKKDKTFTWDFPTSYPNPAGVWVGAYFVPVPVNSVSDIEEIKKYLENKKLFSFFAFSVDYGKKQIRSCTYTEEVVETCIEYVELDKYCGRCLDETKTKRLIEDVCRL